MSENIVETFDKMGRQYQEKVLAAVLTDISFADQMSDVLKPSYFSFTHLESIARAFFSYHSKHGSFPTISLIPTLLKHDPKWMTDELTQEIVSKYLASVIDSPLCGDRNWIEESSLDFCRRQAVIEAVEGILTDVDKSDYSLMRKRMQDALEKGSKKDFGHEISDELSIEARAKKAVREPISTGWPPLDKVLNGGLKRKTLSTFIAATGAGKSMFLVNVGCALAQQGYNVVYFSLELSEEDIALRCDSYFGNIPIDSVPDNTDKIIDIMKNVPGRMIIKEYPTKRATIDTLRNHLERLRLTKNFVADAVIVDYADLLKSIGNHSESRHGLTENYQELRAFASDYNVICVTADQTNRVGLETDLVTIGEIGECYAKALICDLIMTITRNQQMKSEGRGRLYNAKSRLGKDGQVFDFMMDTDKSVRVEMLDFGSEPITAMAKDPERNRQRMREIMDDIKTKAIAKESYQ